MKNQIELIANSEIEIFDDKSENEIIIFEEKKKVKLAAIFTPQGIDKVLDLITKKAKQTAPDISTQKGRDQIKSIAHTVAKCKAPLEKIAKHLKEDHYKIIDGINEQRDRALACLDVLRDEIRQPVTEIEEREAKLLAERKERIERIKNHGMLYNSTLQDIKVAIENVKEILDFDNWGEFQFAAENTAKEVIEQLEALFKQKEEQIKKDAELEKLRKEAAERAQKDHEEKIAREAAEKAKKEAEEVAERERKAEEQRRLQLEEEKRVAQEKAIIEKRKSEMFSIGLMKDPMTGDFIFGGNDNDIEIKAFQFLEKVSEQDWEKLLERVAADVVKVLEKRKIDAENRAKEAEKLAKEQEEQHRLKVAEYERQVAETKRLAEEGRAAAEKKAKEDAEKAAAAAVEAERARVEAQRKADEAAAEKLAANKRHCAKINNEAISSLSEVLLKCDFDLSDGKSLAKGIIEAIARGEVPHVSIKY